MKKRILRTLIRDIIVDIDHQVAELVVVIRDAGVTAAAEAISRATAGRHKVLAFGNGGSAPDARHLVAKLVGVLEGSAEGWPRSHRSRIRAW